MKHDASRYFIIAIALILASCSREQSGPGRSASDSAAPAAAPAQPVQTTNRDSVSGVRPRTVPIGSVDTLEGTLYVSGNVPFTRLTLYLAGKKTVYLNADETVTKELRQLQGQRIRVAGRTVKGPTGNEIVVKEFKSIQ